MDIICSPSVDKEQVVKFETVFYTFRYMWTDFYQELEDGVDKFFLNEEVQVATERYPGNLPTEFKSIIHSYTYITLSMIDYHCKNLQANN